MEKPKWIILTLTLLSSAVAGTGEMDVLVNADRELAGLLDAYLEGVPECPARPDTPLRVWVLDLAWLRADAAIDEMADVDMTRRLPDTLAFAWTDFVSSSGRLFDVFTEVQEAYHRPEMPDSQLCVELEDRLIRADSVWRSSERVLFELLAEEGNQ